VVAEADIGGLSTDDALSLRFAALLHDVSKPATKGVNNRGEICFHGHEDESGLTAERILRRLKLPKKVIDKAVHLVKAHMINYDLAAWTDAAVRKFVFRVGEVNLKPAA
jgi:poly(A) polymerase